jgi:hypothetical protein
VLLNLLVRWQIFYSRLRRSFPFFPQWQRFAFPLRAALTAFCAFFLWFHLLPYPYQFGLSCKEINRAKSVEKAKRYRRDGTFFWQQMAEIQLDGKMRNGRDGFCAWEEMGRKSPGPSSPFDYSSQMF